MKLSTKTRNDILNTIKASLRGKKNTWHVIAFEYYGYQLGAKMHGVHAQRIEIHSPHGGTILMSMGYDVKTIKAAVEWFSEAIDFLDLKLESDWRDGLIRGDKELEYILHHDPLGVLSTDGEMIKNGVGMSYKEYRESLGIIA